MYIVYGKPNCPNCQKAKAILDSNGASYRYVDVSEDIVSFNFLATCGHRSVPQVYLGDREGNPITLVGGYTELTKQLAA